MSGPAAALSLATMPGHQPAPKVLIAGGGVAALEALLALRATAGELPHVSVLAPEGDFVLRASAVLEPFARGHARKIPLRSIVESQAAQLVPGALASVDPAARTVTTATGEEIAYDHLLVALGARGEQAFPGAVSFGGPQDREALTAVLAQAESGDISSIAFVVPPGATWPLPLYELALLTRAHLRGYGREDVEIHVVTPEERPLEVFGHDASSDLESRIEQDDIELHTMTRARKHEDGVLAFEGGGRVHADRAVALPRLTGPAIHGLPHDDLGFIPTDDHARVSGVENVFAAGDCTCFPLKQGGIAAQQADAAAQAIAEAIGAGVEAAPFRPVLRGLLLTGDEPSYFRAYPGAEREPASVAIDAPRRSREEAPANVAGHRPLWWPPTKVAGPYLGAWLARPHEPGGEPLQIEDRELEPSGDEAAAAQERESALDLALAMADGEARFGDWKAALRALDAAEALAGALPPEYAQKRDLWQAELSGTPTTRFRGD